MAAASMQPPMSAARPSSARIGSRASSRGCWAWTIHRNAGIGAPAEMMSTPGARLAGTGYLGYGTACAAKEGMARLLAAELAPAGIRVVCLRSHAIPQASARGSHSERVFRPIAEQAGLSVGEMLQGAAQGTLLKRLPTLEQVAETAVFMASDRAGAMTGVVANLTCGAVAD